jgi:hypothetical protein
MNIGQHIKAYMGNRGIAPLILKSVLDAGQLSALHAGRFSPREKDRTKVKVKLHFFFNLGGRWELVSVTPQPLYPREWPGTYCIGWAGIAQSV